MRRRPFRSSALGVLLLSGLIVQAQERVPPIGIPFRTNMKATAAEVNGAALSIAYGPTPMRGRKIFGDLVPFGQVWCIGDGGCARFNTDRDLKFGNLKIEAGEYSLWLLPTETLWTMVFNSNSRSANQSRYNQKLDVGRVELQKQTLPSPVEQLTFTIEENASGRGGTIALDWETTRVVAPFTVVN